MEVRAITTMAQWAVATWTHEAAKRVQPLETWVTAGTFRKLHAKRCWEHVGQWLMATRGWHAAHIFAARQLEALLHLCASCTIAAVALQHGPQNDLQAMRLVHF